MLVIQVAVHVKPEWVEAFRTATIENARNSVREPGIARFDVIQQREDATRFILIEAYRTAEGPVAHKETLHYRKWRETVEPMMAEPRRGVMYDNVFPSDTDY